MYRLSCSLGDQKKSAQAKEEKEILKDRELLENLELLQNLDTIKYIDFLSNKKAVKNNDNRPANPPAKSNEKKNQ